MELKNRIERNIRLFIDELEYIEGPYPYELAEEMTELADRVAEAETATEALTITEGAFNTVA